MMVLMPCRAADTGKGTELSTAFTAVSLSTPVMRKSTVGRMVMLPAGWETETVRGSFLISTPEAEVRIIVLPNAITLLQSRNAEITGQAELELNERVIKLSCVCFCASGLTSRRAE